jgi:hypothetical protein
VLTGAQRDAARVRARRVKMTLRDATGPISIQREANILRAAKVRTVARP